MSMKTLNDLFVHFVRDIYYAEKQVLKTLPKMARKADSDKLRAAFEHHREETEGQIENLVKVFEILGLKARGGVGEAAGPHRDGSAAAGEPRPGIRRRQEAFGSGRGRP